MPARSRLEKALTEYEAAVDDIDADDLSPELRELAEAVRERIALDTVDHNAAARTLLADLHQRDEGGVGMIHFAATTAHAMLAVAEQLRIANVIAVGEQFDPPVEWSNEARTLRADVRQGLGL